MPSLPISFLDGSQIDGGPVPVSSAADVLNVLPSGLAASTTAPVRDAIVAGMTEIFRQYQKSAAYAADQVNPVRATGLYLQGLGQDRGLAYTGNLTDDQYRAAIYGGTMVVTPAAILSQVDTILSPYTTVLAQLSDGFLDQPYIPDSTSAGYSTFVGASPSYPERLYSDDALNNGGVSRPQSSVGGFRVFDGVQRTFLLRIPDLSPTDADNWFTFSDSEPGQEVRPNNISSVFQNIASGDPRVFNTSASSIAIYNQIIAVVSAIKAQGYRFILLVDPTLS